MAGRPVLARELLSDAGRLSVPAGSAAADLEHAGAQLAQHAAQGVPLCIGGHGGRDFDPENLLALAGEVTDAKTQSASQHPFSDQAFHSVDLFRGGVPFLAVLAHDVTPYSGVAYQRAYVDTAVPAEGVEVFRDGLPSEIHSRTLRLQGDSFHPVEHLEVPIAVTRTGRGQHQPALPDDYRGVAV